MKAPKSWHRKSNWLGKPAAEIDAEYQAWADQQPVISRCRFCPDWHAEGTAIEARIAAQQHRQEHHPDVRWTKRQMRRSLRGPKRMLDLRLSGEDLAEIQAERLKRARAHGIEEELV